MNLTDRFLQFALLGAEWVLWLLVALSVMSVYVMLERWLYFRSVAGHDAKLRKRLVDALAEGDDASARGLVRDAKGVGARMVAALLTHAHRSPAAIDASVAAVRSEEKLRLDRNLSFLATLGANAPFIGLFGTVLGMIRALKEVSERGLAEHSQELMAGIYEALVATAVGLIVAIPAVVAYNIFQRRVKAMLGEADALVGSVYPLAVGRPLVDGPREED